MDKIKSLAGVMLSDDMLFIVIQVLGLISVGFALSDKLGMAYLLLYVSFFALLLRTHLENVVDTEDAIEEHGDEQ